MLWLALYFPELATDLLCQSDPRASAPPICILEPDQRTVRQCNAAARSYGIRPGHSSATALCLAPDAVTRLHAPERQQRALKALAQWAYGIVPTVAPVEEDQLLLEISGMGRLYPDLDTLCQRIEQQLLGQGYQLQWAIGPTPLAARLLARAGAGTDTLQLHVIEQRLLHLQVSQLRLETDTVQRLRSMGISTLAQLRQLPSSALARRFGHSLPHYLERLFGDRPDPQPRYRPEETFHHRQPLLHEAETSGSLLFALQRQLQQLETFMRLRQLATSSVQISLHHRDHEHTRLVLQAAAPLSTSREFNQLALLRLERLPLPAAVIEISLEANRFAPRSEHDGDLFDSTGSASQAGQQQFLSRLYARLGQAQVRGISVADDHRPEAAHRWGFASGPVAPSPDVRPLWLLPRPQRLTQAFVLQEGPERITTGWWQPPPIRRDYFIARLDNQALAWVFRDPCGHWYLHGWFG